MLTTRRFVIKLVISIVLLALLIVNTAWAQAIAGLVIAIVLPGYLLTQALLPPHTDLPTRIVLSVGTSLAIDAVGGLILNLTPWGLQPLTWLLLLLGLGILFAVIAIRRRTWDLAIRLNLGIRAREGVLFGFAMVIGLVALQIAGTPASPQSIEGYTNFWAVPLDSAAPSTNRFGIKSMEVKPMEFSLEIKVDDQTVSQMSIILLKPGDQWEGELDIPVPQTASTRIEANLYRLDNPQSIYRQIILNRHK